MTISVFARFMRDYLSKQNIQNGEAMLFIFYIIHSRSSLHTIRVK